VAAKRHVAISNRNRRSLGEERLAAVPSRKAEMLAKMAAAKRSKEAPAPGSIAAAMTGENLGIEAVEAENGHNSSKKRRNGPASIGEK